RPPRIGKYFLRLRTLRSGSAMGGLSVQEAGHLVARPHFLERRRVLEVHGFGQRAARREAAARLLGTTQGRDRPRNRLELLLARRGPVDSRNRAQPALRVWVHRLRDTIAA